MSDEAKRMNDLAFSIVTETLETLEKAGTPENRLEAETMTCILLAYSIAAKCAGRTFDELRPIIEQAFKIPQKAHINAKGGTS